MGRTFPLVQSLLGPLSQLPFWHCPHCGYIPCLPLSQISSPNTNQVTGGTGSSLCFVTCRCVSFLLASGNAVTAAECQEHKFLCSQACLSPSRPLLLKTLEMASCLSLWFTVSPCPGASLLEQQVELKAVDAALIFKELLIKLPSSGGLGIPACFLLGFKIKRKKIPSCDLYKWTFEVPAFSVTSFVSLNVPLVWRQSFWVLFCAAVQGDCMVNTVCPNAYECPTSELGAAKAWSNVICGVTSNWEL